MVQKIKERKLALALRGSKIHKAKRSNDRSVMRADIHELAP